MQSLGSVEPRRRSTASRNATIRQSVHHLSVRESIIKRGYLVKSPPLKASGGGGFRRWRRRWCVLQRDFEDKISLMYYKDEKAYRAKKPCLGVIAVDEATDCYPDAIRHKKHTYGWCIKLPQRTYYLITDSHFEMNRWFQCVVASVPHLSKPKVVSENEPYVVEEDTSELLCEGDSSDDDDDYVQIRKDARKV